MKYKSEKEILINLEKEYTEEKIEQVEEVLNILKNDLHSEPKEKTVITNIEKYMEIQKNIIETNILRNQIMDKINNKEGIPIIKKHLETIKANNELLEKQIVEYLL
jgi:RecA-family ATPase